jgi:GDSL-like Lipase/Acylhydrolase family
MAKSRLASAASALILTAVVALTGAGPARSAGPGYVAVGDSYAAGLGAGHYDSGSGDCKRSTKAYPALWAAAHKPSSFAFTACAGARTGEVTGRQLGPITKTTGLVSVTVGGNDAGFADVMTTCVLHSPSTCLDRVAEARTFVKEKLPGLLDTTYDAIRARGPQAHVVVLGYPHVYQVPGDCLLGLSDASRKAINAAADDLDDVIAKRAADHGFAYADVRSTFTGHELCSGSVWLHGVTYPVDESYHPTATGQSDGCLPPFSAAA